MKKEDNFDEKFQENDKEKKRGRPKTIVISKEEYHHQYYLQRYSQNKEEIKANCAKNSKKYRESYKLLLEIYEKKMLEEADISKIEKILQ